METKKKALFILPIFAVLLTVGAFSVPLSSNQITETNVIDQQRMTGFVTLQLIDKETGIVKQTIKNHNLIVDVGLDEEAQAIFGAGGVGSTFFNYLDIGVSATAPSPTDVGLGTPIGGCARVQDLSPDTVSPTGEISISVISQFDGSTCAGSIVETAIFNSASGGQVLGRSVFGVITLTATDLLNVNYTVTLT
jgi:hypothetical protein